jgi:hypothetical protein
MIIAKPAGGLRWRARIAAEQSQSWCQRGCRARSKAVSSSRWDSPPHSKAAPGFACASPWQADAARRDEANRLLRFEPNFAQGKRGKGQERSTNEANWTCTLVYCLENTYRRNDALQAAAKRTQFRLRRGSAKQTQSWRLWSAASSPPWSAVASPRGTTTPLWIGEQAERQEAEGVLCRTDPIRRAEDVCDSNPNSLGSNRLEGEPGGR